jgi:hypothetical protein
MVDPNDLCASLDHHRSVACHDIAGQGRQDREGRYRLLDRARYFLPDPHESLRSSLRVAQAFRVQDPVSFIIHILNIRCNNDLFQE